MRVDQAGGGGLLPGEVVRLGHQLVGLDQRDVGEPAEVGLEAPDALLGVHHRVVVAVGALQLDRQAVGDDLVAGVPRVHAEAGLEHHAGQVGADDVVGQVVPLRQRGDPAVALEEAEGRQRLEDRGPHGVVVDGTGHHRDEGLARAELRQRHVVHVQRLAGVLVPARHSLEHVDLVLADDGCPVGLRELEVGVVLSGGVAGEDGVEDLLHGFCSWSRSGWARRYLPSRYVAAVSGV